MFSCCEVLLLLNKYSSLYINWNWCSGSKFIDSFEGENNSKKEKDRYFQLNGQSLMHSYQFRWISAISDLQ
jgi:hypothetical protein